MLSIILLPIYIMPITSDNFDLLTLITKLTFITEIGWNVIVVWK